MRRTILIAAFFCALLSISETVRGQVTFSVNFDTLNFIQPTTAGFGDSINYTIDVINNSNTDFIGRVSILRKVNNGIADTIFTDIINDTLVANSSRPYFLEDSVFPARFGGGINVVVVWPTAPGVTTSDSATGTINVTGVGIPEQLHDAYPITVFPNPTAGAIRFQTQFSPLLVHQTVLMDQQGRTLRSTQRIPSEMSLDGLSAGIYFIEIRLRDGAIRRFRVVKTN
jgi:hypothetical protein